MAQAEGGRLGGRRGEGGLEAGIKVPEGGPGVVVLVALVLLGVPVGQGGGLGGRRAGEGVDDADEGGGEDAGGAAALAPGGAWREGQD